MVLEIVGLVLGVISLILLAVVLRFVLKSPAVALDRLARQVEQSQREVAEMRTSVARLEERTKVMPLISTMISAVNEKTNAIPGSVSLLGKVEERTRGVAEATARIPAVETKVQQLDQIRLSLEDLAGRLKSERRFGKIGEEAVESILATFPEDSWRAQVTLSGGGRVDFAFLLPNGKMLPIDSKTGGSETVAQIANSTQELKLLAPDDSRRNELLRHVRELSAGLDRQIQSQAYEVGEYLKGEDQCLSIAVMAVPDPVFDLIPARTRGAATSYGVELVPYSLVPPFLNYIRRQNLYGESRLETVLSSLAKARQSLDAVDDMVKNSLERASTMLGNAIRNIRAELALARNLLEGTEAKSDSGTEPLAPRPDSAEE